jgi:hypothetical protein
MLPEMLRFSSRHRLLDSIPEELKNAHKTQEKGGRSSLFTKATHEEEEEDEEDGGHSYFFNDLNGDFGDDDLTALGL